MMSWLVGEVDGVGSRSWVRESVLILILFACAAVWLSGCGGVNPPPPPPPPPWSCDLPMPECGELDQQCSTPESPCWHNPTTDPEHCEEAPLCPEPPPPPPPPPPCKPGKQARVYWYTSNKTADATPARCGCQNCEEWIAQDGTQCYTGRYCCPVGCEDDPERAEREARLMGGDLPAWELQVTTGNLSRSNPGGWKFTVKGRGKGRLRWCFPGYPTVCSKWLEVDR